MTVTSYPCFIALIARSELLITVKLNQTPNPGPPGDADNSVSVPTISRDDNGLAHTYASNGHASNGTHDPQGRYAPYGYVPAEYRTAPTPAVNENAEGVDIRHSLSVLVRHRILFVVALLAVIVVGTLYSLTLRRIYAASATVLINPSARSSSQSDLPAISDIVEANRGRSVETQIEIFNSGPVLQQAIAHLSPSDAASIGQHYNLRVTPVRGTDVIAIYVETYSPHAASALANAICDAYIRQNKQQNQEQLESATGYVQHQLATVQGRLNAAREAVKRYKLAHNTVDLQTESVSRVTQVGKIQDDLRADETAARATTAQLAELRADAARMSPVETVPSAIVRPPTVSLMNEELTKLELDRLSAIQEYTRQSPEVRSIEGQMAGIRRQIRLAPQTEISGWLRTANPVRLALVQNIATLQGQLEAQQASAGALRAALAQAQAGLSQLPQYEASLGQLMTDLTSQQQTYQLLREKYETLRISQNMSVANAHILTPAVTRDTPIRPSRIRNFMLSVILGLVLATALVMLADRLDNRITSEADVERATQRPALTFVPFFANPGKLSLLSDTAKNSPLLESYRMLRNNIAFAAVDQPIRSLMLTSSQPNEGKSTSCVNLAVAMAMDGKRVVLIDCDLRRPSQHKLFNLSNQIGFTNVVAGTTALEAALQETVIPGLRVLTSGPIPPNPPELLNSQASQACLEQIMQQVDFMVVDTPPALAISDSQVIATKVDAVLLVIAGREAHKHAVRRTMDLLENTGTRVLGSILNKLTIEFGEYGEYGHYSSSYYKSYKSYFDDPAAPASTSTAATPDEAAVGAVAESEQKSE